MRIYFTSSKELFPEHLNEPNVLFVMPFTDISMAKKASKLIAQRANYQGSILCIHDTYQEGFVSIINKAFKYSGSLYFGYIAQDVFPGREWLKIAMTSMLQHKAGLLAFNDGKWHGAIASFGMVNQQWAKKNYEGDLFHPSYQQHYADTELTILAQVNEVFCYEPNSVMLEIDWDKDLKSINKNDRICFDNRCQTGFNGLISPQQIRQPN